VTERSRLMKATGMRIRIRIERESRRARVADKKREVGDILKDNNEGTDVRTCRSRWGLSEVWPWPCQGLYTLSIEPHCGSVPQNNDLWATRRIV
jgi:hypothetical protein